MARKTPLLHRDNPDKEPLVGHVKVTREDWLNTARDVLVTEGAASVKILPLANRLGVSRSSFYWYFRNREDLLAALLEEWETRNTTCIRAHCDAAAGNITEAVCNFFRCFIDETLFDTGLDFAVREWSRRDPSVRAQVDAADAARLAAVTAMFAAQGYGPGEADARARILYYMQLGYHALDVREDMETRMGRIEAYIKGFTGREPDARALNAFSDFARGAAP